jgi:NodT family efflux transporter outer membrane factor (OMF) lipoprotein
MRKPALLLLFLATSACAPQARLAVAPGVASDEWQGPVAADTLPVSEPLARSLGSAELVALTERALANNADIGAAIARIERARAELKGARNEMLPAVTGSAGIAATRTDDKNQSLYRFSEAFAGLDITYDLDIGGSAKAGARAAGHRFKAAASDRQAVALSVEADLARAYVQYCALAERIRILDRQITDAAELERIIGVRVREGASTKLDLGLQAIEVRQLRAGRTRLVEAQLRTRSALAILVGAEAPAFGLAGSELAVLHMPALRPLQPAELLSRRPDLQAAEARIAAARGDVDAARRAFVPTLSLSASGLVQAASFGGPLGATLSAGSALLAPIFARGRLTGRLETVTADQHESVELYRKALLVALGQAQDALNSTEQSRLRHELVKDMVGQARTSARLARLQYLEGEADLTEMLSAQSELVQAEDALAIAVQERLEAAIDLYAAMGGLPGR